MPHVVQTQLWSISLVGLATHLQDTQNIFQSLRIMQTLSWLLKKEYVTYSIMPSSAGSGTASVWVMTLRNSEYSCDSVSGPERSVEKSSRSVLLRLAARKHAKLAESTPLRRPFLQFVYFFHQTSMKEHFARCARFGRASRSSMSPPL
jgi:hypothetical protein